MSDFKRPVELQTMQEVALYVGACLDQRGKLDDEHVASNIVGLVSNDNFDDWYGADADFAAMFDLASDLEWSNTRLPALDWAELRTHIEQLKQRYLITDGTHDSSKAV